jgi:5-methylcytosine-specific restriction endonuclease McrA
MKVEQRVTQTTLEELRSLRCGHAHLPAGGWCWHCRRRVPSRASLRRRAVRRLAQWYGWHCHYCRYGLNLRSATVDHVIPKALGGRNVISNLVLACLPCNQAKKDSSYGEFLNSGWLTSRQRTVRQQI